MAEDADRLREMVAEVAAAYFSNSHVSPAEIPNVLQQIASGLTAVGGASASQAGGDDAGVRTKVSGAQARKSITPDGLISFEDNKPYKTMKRHLSGRGLTPEQYREKWGLPADYPMVAPNYSAARSAMAKSLGLGQMRSKAAAKAPVKGKPRGRPKAST